MVSRLALAELSESYGCRKYKKRRPEASLYEPDRDLQGWKCKAISIYLTSNQQARRKPNVAIWLLDSVAQQHAHRSLPLTMELLMEIDESPYFDVLEFKRYHVVGWHSAGNQVALFAGTPFSHVTRQKVILLSSSWTSKLNWRLCGEKTFRFHNTLQSTSCVTKACGDSSSKKDTLPLI